jgi:bacillithiol biosynthesis cysteine-adding enzyme BshC
MRISIADLPSLSPLVRDYHLANDEVSEFFNGDFRDPTAYERQKCRLRSREYARGQLAEILREQNQSSGCGPQTLQNIEALVRNETCAVVTGQQVALFSGPLYSIYKALTAVKLAEHLNQQLGVPVVPIFWLATDDHDFAEVDHIDLLDQAGQLQRIFYKDCPAQDRVQVGGLRFSAQIEACVGALDEMTPQSEFKPEIMSLLKEAYQPGRTFAEAFAIWMTHLFGAHGLVLIDPCHPDLIAMAREPLLAEIRGGSPSSRCVMRTSQRLTEKDYTPQVRQQAGKLNLFLVEHERFAIHVAGDGFSVKDPERRFTRDELVEMVHTTPHAFSPNVLLRPLVQDTILPTVAYVGGPGEIAYFAQLRGAYEEFNIPMPVVYPRKSFTVLERHVASTLETLSISMQDVWGGLSAKRNALAAEEIPEPLQQALTTAAGNLQRDLGAVCREATAMDSALGQSADGIHRKIHHQLNLLETKVVQAAKKKQKIVGRKLTKVENMLYPNQRLQERVFNVTPFLMKYGVAWLEDLYHALDLTHVDHQVFSFEAEK